MSESALGRGPLQVCFPPNDKFHILMIAVQL